MRVAFFQRVFAHYQGGLAKALAASSEHDYHFYGDDRDPLQSGIEPYLFPRHARFTVCHTWHRGPHLAWQGSALHTAAAGDYDALILEGTYNLLSNWPALLAARARRKRTLLYGHGWLREESGAKGRLRNAFYRLADAHLLYGNRARQIGMRAGFNPEALHVVHNSLNYESITAARERVTESDCRAWRRQLLGDGEMRPLLLCVGRLVAAKQLDLLLEAAAVMQARGIPPNLVLVGDGPEREALEQKARAKELDVRFLAAEHDEERLALIFSSADVTVIPGAAGLTVIHSLSYGTPVITHSDMDTQMPEAEAIAPGSTGFLFKPGDAVALSETISQCLRELPRSNQTRVNCINQVEASYTPKRMQTVFDRAVSGSPASSEGLQR